MVRPNTVLLLVIASCGPAAAPAHAPAPVAATPAGGTSAGATSTGTTSSKSSDVAPTPPPAVEVGPPELEDSAAESVGWDAGVEAPPEPSAEQRAAWLSEASKTIYEAQLYRSTTSATFVLPDGRAGTATLVDLAPAIGVWTTLTVAWDGGATDTWHLEAPSGHVRLRLDDGFPSGLVVDRDGVETRCDLWGGSPTALDAARGSGQIYAPVCDGALYVRNVAVGRRTPLEWSTDFLRDHVWGGEAITSAVKETVMADAGRVTADLAGTGTAPLATAGPRAPDVAPEAVGRLVTPETLGVPVDGDQDGQLVVGGWYPVHGTPGAYLSVMEPGLVSQDVLDRNAPYTRKLDDVEAPSLVYTVAFDLSKFDLGYEVGTDHPRLDWSDRIPDASKDASLPGPDGYDTMAPLVRTGELDPAYQSRMVAAFVGGFKRYHGAFTTGELSRVNHASHYGFVEFGTQLSKLQPGLATLVVWANGAVDLKTWTSADDDRLWAVRHARQNGVPLLEPDPETGEVRPGDHVKEWAGGNWSGSVEGNQRSLRSGVCIQDTPNGRYLLYGWFSSATPSAMADVFSAYGCSYAMLLDMNALEHTYLAFSGVDGGEAYVHHLDEGMDVLDKEKGGHLYPRFVGFPDNRDFFYVLRKEDR